MEFLLSWIKGAAAAGISGGIILMLCPDGRMKNGVKICVGLFVLLAFAAPLTSGGISITIPDFPDTSVGTEKVDDYIQSTAATVSEVLERRIRAVFTENGLSYSYVKARIAAENDRYIISSLTLYCTEEEKNQAEKILNHQLKIDNKVIITEVIE